MKSGFILTLLALAIAGCAGPRATGMAESVQLVELEALPEPEGARSQRIGPYQALEVTVVGVEELGGTYQTDENGSVFFPLAGEVNLNGKTPTSAARTIAAALDGQYVIDPQVRVLVQDGGRSSLSIGGEVERPGSYSVNTAYSLLRAINDAGGLSDKAKSDDVLIMREVGGQNYIGVYNLAAIARGNYPDPTVLPGDIVMVGENRTRSLILEALQLTPFLSSFVILIDRI